MFQLLKHVLQLTSDLFERETIDENEKYFITIAKK